MPNDDLQKRLRIKAGMIEMCEKIEWGSDTALMREAAEQLDAKQAKIDALMLEHCPEEMTPEQVTNWEKNQKPVEA